MSSIKNWLKNPYHVFGLSLILYLFFGFALSTPLEIAEGIIKIVESPDRLVTDYIEVGGIGAAFVNAALVGATGLFILVKCNHEPTGVTLMALWLMAGFSFFGKNIVNILPILFGGYLCSVITHSSFKKYVLYTLLGTTLAPAVAQVAIANEGPRWIGVVSGILMGVFIGLIITPLARQTAKAHDGFNLYNVGFAGGIIAIMILAMFRYFGVSFMPNSVWSSGHSIVISAFVLIQSALLIAIGLISGESPKSQYQKLKKLDARQNDYFAQIKESCYINMGILGIYTVFLLALLRAELSGPVVAGIFTIVGFGCYGKTIKNITPILTGIILMASIGPYELNDQSVIVSLLFSTGLAPIATHFGFIWGVVAGFVHLPVSLHMGNLHGGLSLYSNGLAAGFVAMVFVPMINAFKKVHTGRKSKDEIDI